MATERQSSKCFSNLSELARKATKISQKSAYLIAVVYLFFAIVCDIVFHNTGIGIIVQASYPTAVLDALCTIAALGNAILSIIIGAFSNKIYGFTVRELISNNPKSFSVPSVVISSLFAVVLGIVSLSFDLCATITALAICVVGIIAITSAQLWLLLSNTKYQKEIMDNIIKADILEPEFYYTRWFPELTSAIECNDEPSQHIYIELIRTVLDSEKGSRPMWKSIVEKNATNIFPSACMRLGFVEAYKRVICLDDWSYRGLDAYSVANSYISRLRYLSEEHIVNYRVPETIDDILERLEISQEDKAYYVYNIYHSLRDNRAIRKDVQNNLTDSIFERLCWLRNSNNGETRKRVILQIAKHDIFENEDIRDRKDVLTVLNRQLYCNNRYSHCETYISLISQLFRALYFYSTLETETLSEEYRAELAPLFQFGYSGKDRFKITLSLIIAFSSDEVVHWLANDMDLFSNHFGFFEYFPNDSSAKCSIWTPERCLIFAFEYYLIVGFRFSLFPIGEKVEDEKIDIQTRRRMCEIIVGCFEGDKKLSDRIVSEIEALQNFIGKDYSLVDSLAPPNFDYFNGKLLEINKAINGELKNHVSSDLDNLNQQLSKEFEKMESFEYDESLDFTHARKVKIPPITRRVTRDDVVWSAQDKAHIIETFLNRMVKEILPAKTLSFDQRGVDALLTELSDKQYKARNYSFVDDWAIKEPVRQSSNYSQLCQKIEEIPLIKGYGLNHHIFLLTDKIKFNAKVLSYQVESPKESQCEAYISNYKIADSKYRIDGSILDHTTALEYVKKNYIVEYTELSISINLSKEDGIVIRTTLDRI